MEIVKTDGTHEPFSTSKLCLSLRKAGAPRAVADSICKMVEPKVNPSDSTNTIFRHALNYLVRQDLGVAARYSLRRGLEELGPAGFIFEQYLETILQAYGFLTKRDLMIAGRCISHEVDIIAGSGSKRFLIEAKYHNDSSIKTHVDVIMYADARLVDIVKAEPEQEQKDYENAMWVITNTKFTDQSIKYARCRGIRLTGWNYPRGESLEDVISQKRLYPVTVLPSLPKLALPEMAKRNIILAQDLLTYGKEDLIKTFGFTDELAAQLVDEIQGIAGPAARNESTS